jgi:hypothetical protein
MLVTMRALGSEGCAGDSVIDVIVSGQASDRNNLFLFLISIMSAFSIMGVID